MNASTIFCDGSSIGNPGPGGWGAVISSLKGKEKSVEEVGGFDPETTNNRMELTAAMEALKKVKEGEATLIKTDSRYVINGITKWVYGWERNEWKTMQKKDVLNKDLWQALMKVTLKLDVTWEHVRGHVGVSLNERADQIANGYARKEKVTLFKGSESDHAEFLKGMPKARVVSSSSKNRGKAYSYVSLVDGIVRIHQTWAECEKHVKGRKAKYKKALSKEDEAALKLAWRNSNF